MPSGEVASKSRATSPLRTPVRTPLTGAVSTSVARGVDAALLSRVSHQAPNTAAASSGAARSKRRQFRIFMLCSRGYDADKGSSLRADAPFA